MLESKWKIFLRLVVLSLIGGMLAFPLGGVLPFFGGSILFLLATAATEIIALLQKIPKSLL